MDGSTTIVAASHISVPASVNVPGSCVAVITSSVILGKLNDPAQNVGSPTINRPTEDLDVPEIAEVIYPAEYSALAEYDKEWVRMFIGRPENAPLKPYQGKFTSVFPGGSVTLTAVLALRVKPASRAEILFGVNTVISRPDYAAMRNS